MSVVAKALKDAGLNLVGDSLPPKDRKVKTFQRLIAAMRACEADVQDQLSESERQLNNSLQATLELQGRVHALEGELLKLRLEKSLNDVASLTTADRQKVLAAAPTAAA
jgi:hypothetical protein